MKKSASCLASALFSLLTLSSAFGESAKYKNYTITGPYQHKNLSVFLVRGKDAFDGKDVLTLEEAMDAKKLVIYETQNVNELKMENKSTREKVFIQAGDIIKGGQQDRVIQEDLIITPMSGKKDISVFCVEANRWAGRGLENSRVFSSSKDQLPSKALKLAAYASSPREGTSPHGLPAPQQKVWEQVGVAQADLSANVGKNVRNKQSESSLLLALEDKDLRKRMKEYSDDINRQVKDTKDAVGYVTVVNGAINSGDLYGNRALFTKLWGKLVNSSSIEAISQLNKGGKPAELQASDISKWLEEVEKIKAVRTTSNKGKEAIKRDSKDNFSLETYEKARPGQWIHKTLIKK